MCSQVNLQRQRLRTKQSMLQEIRMMAQVLSSSSDRKIIW